MSFQYVQFMDEKNLFPKILGINLPWIIEQIVVNEKSQILTVHSITLITNSVDLHPMQSHVMASARQS